MISLLGLPSGKTQFQAATKSVLSIELRQVDHMKTRKFTLAGSLLAASPMPAALDKIVKERETIDITC